MLRLVLLNMVFGSLSVIC